jgi:REP element-mobilizing transposase RayT
MAFNNKIHHRHSIRLPEYDYSQPNAYFITICSFQKECLFGEIMGGEMRVNEIGMIAKNTWDRLEDHFALIETDEFVIMPNHIHGIIMIHDPVGAGLSRPDSASRPNRINTPVIDGAATGYGWECGEGVEFGEGGTSPPLRKKWTLGQIVGYFKYESIRRMIMTGKMPMIRLWQRNYYERIIRSDSELDAIRKYIAENPLKWNEDPERPVVNLI